MFLDCKGCHRIDLHRYTGIWNLEDFIGHCLGIACAGTAVYMLLVRFGDDNTVQRIFTMRVTWPLTLVIPLLAALFLCSRAVGIEAAHMEDIAGRYRLTSYWLLLCGTLIYLLICAARLLILLVRVERGHARAVAALYQITVGLTALAALLLGVHAVTPFHLRDIALPIGYLAALGWVITPAYSWHRKTHLRIAAPDELAKTVDDPAIPHEPAARRQREDDPGERA